jgi:hypothetical protein
VARVITIPYKPRTMQRKLHDAIEGYRHKVLVIHRRFGKTVMSINHLIKKALTVSRPRPRASYVAPYRRQAKDVAWEYLKYYSRAIPGAKPNESELYVEYPNEGRVTLYGADNPDTLRGLYHDEVVMDEVAQMRAEVWDEVVQPALQDRRGGSLFIGTPKGINLFSQRYEAALRDPKWFAALYDVYATSVFQPEDIEEIKSGMSDSAFRQEFLCDFGASSDNMLIGFDVVREAANRVLHPNVFRHAPIVMALDVARFGDDSSVLVTRQGLAVRELKTWIDTDIMTLASLTAQEARRLEPDAIFVDEVGVGAGAVDRLIQLGFNIIPVNGGKRANNENQYFNKRTEMWWKMKVWLEAGASIPDNMQLRADLVAPTYEYDPRDRVKLEKKEDLKERIGNSPDHGDALAMTFAEEVIRANDREVQKYAYPGDAETDYVMFEGDRRKKAGLKGVSDREYQIFGGRL